MQTSFILYHSHWEYLKELSSEELGNVIRAIFEWHSTWTEPESLSRIERMAFIPIRSHLERDREKYEWYLEKQRENGKKWGRPKNNPEDNSDNPENPPVFSETQPNPTEPKKADSVSVSVSVSVSDSEVMDSSLRSESIEPAARNEKKERIDALIETLKAACVTAGVMYSPWSRERERAWNILTAKQFAENAASIGQNPDVFAANIIIAAAKLPYCPATFNAATVYANYPKVFQAAMREKQKLNQRPTWIEA